MVDISSVLLNTLVFTTVGDSLKVNLAGATFWPGSWLVRDFGSVSQTPLPSTWTMLIAGFVSRGFFGYRGSKNRAAALTAA
jgi:hypothetical protein